MPVIERLPRHVGAKEKQNSTKILTRVYLGKKHLCSFILKARVFLPE
jgi:hypothetical protein